uniref:Aspartokinase 2, chloroplastic-like isoform X1 n=1 Tax=Tanacetum cinerariifolium TaxID=118510 RepID=A0A6L2JSA0_TANCI|nr:aspartokinase 2, chloroplastic-like isoform X1 [Tanacetum cinerariifolium]
MMIFQQPTLVSNHPTISSKVWKDLDGVLTCDPNIYLGAEPVPFLTYDEAVELAYFGAQAFTSVYGLPHSIQCPGCYG